MANLLKRSSGWLFRVGGQGLLSAVLRLLGKTVVDSALSTAADVVPTNTPRKQVQVFNVAGPTTVYVRGSHCNIAVRRHDASQVVLEANLVRAFGIDLTATQDDDGIYIVTRRKPVVGSVARTELLLTVPPDSHLAFHLTPGDVIMQGIDGLIEFQAEHVFPATSTPPRPAQ